MSVLPYTRTPMYYRNGCGAVQSVAITLLSQTPSVANTGCPLKMAAELHPRSGKLIGLSNSNRTARRNQPVQEFNHGLVLSKEPLRDRDVFTVRIDKKVNHNRPAAASLARGESSRNAGTAPVGRAGGLSAVRGFCYPGRFTRADSDSGCRSYSGANDLTCQGFCRVRET